MVVSDINGVAAGAVGLRTNTSAFMVTVAPGMGNLSSLPNTFPCMWRTALHLKAAKAAMINGMRISFFICYGF